MSTPTSFESFHGQDSAENSLVVPIDEPVSESANEKAAVRRDAHPPKHAKHAIPKTLAFFTRAFGPDAPVRA